MFILSQAASELILCWTKGAITNTVTNRLTKANLAITDAQSGVEHLVGLLLQGPMQDVDVWSGVWMNCRIGSCHRELQGAGWGAATVSCGEQGGEWQPWAAGSSRGSGHHGLPDGEQLAITGAWRCRNGEPLARCATGASSWPSNTLDCHLPLEMQSKKKKAQGRRWVVPWW
jgi:hypothetical protein